jgi:Cysteine rich repeat
MPGPLALSDQRPVDNLFARHADADLMCLCTLSAGAQQNLVESVVNGCKAELDTYCKDVTPGEGRILGCLYARNDKLSGKCELRSMMPPYSWNSKRALAVKKVWPVITAI